MALAADLESSQRSRNAYRCSLVTVPIGLFSFKCMCCAYWLDIHVPFNDM